MADFRPDNDVLDQVVAVYKEAIHTHGVEEAISGAVKAAVVLIHLMSAATGHRMCTHQCAVRLTQAVLGAAFGNVPINMAEQPTTFKPTRDPGEYDA